MKVGFPLLFSSLFSFELRLMSYRKVEKNNKPEVITQRFLNNNT